MITQLLKKRDLNFERSYSAPLDTIWRAWTEPEMVRQWWGPGKTTIEECEIDLQIGGTIHIVMEADEGMGKYAGTRWPMVGTFSQIDPPTRLVYEARSWTEGEESTTTIHHVNELTLGERDGTTTVELHITITEIGPGAKMAAFGMKWGYKQYFDKLGNFLSSQS